VRKAIREMVSQTCFEEMDFERAHIALLAGNLLLLLLYSLYRSWKVLEP